ncbi:MAG: MiaB/RimO family radical SAM methylthiotransferase [Candidatus Omnitrophica bacterium]|nr:MiaB/RimO family radical SAM methylthiotransferase [Candidatus Omnitrophota bacterium]
MNMRDSEVICGLLQAENYQLTTNPDEADIVIFNTCSVRQHAEDKVWSEIGRYKNEGPSRSLRTNHPRKKIIGVIGCMAQSYKEKVFERAPRVDFAAGPQDIHKIPQIIKDLTKEKSGQSPSGDSPLFLRKIWETDGGIRPEEIYHTGFHEDKARAYVVISEGCSNFCSYCVVPYVRGPLRNRKYKDILKEIEEAVAQGITSVTLLGQNVNAYEDGKVRLVELIRLIELVKGLKEFSFITSHPKDTTIDLFKAMAHSHKLKKHLHLPVQSGSDRILGLMNRGYSKDFYLDLADNYRKIIKGGILTTDIIVGFPTETDKDFRDTYNLAEGIGFDAAFIFKYSVRPHTAAGGLADDVPRQEKERRHALILQLQKKISKKVPL